MLAHTLCHIPRVSLNKEQDLWAQGIHSWDSYRLLSKHPTFLDNCEHHLKQGNPTFFADNLKSDQHWRLFADFRSSVAYVDIETTGLSKGYDYITTIALYDGTQVRTYVAGRNLEAFKSDIQDFRLLVTFNGKTFDVPFIERSFGIKMPEAHIDLRYVMKRQGYSGGLKEVERRLGIDRGDLRSVDGFFAVTLWHEYQKRHNEAALETLLAYNCADVINLEQLMVHAYNANVRATPFGKDLEIPLPVAVQIPFKVCSTLVDRYAW